MQRHEACDQPEQRGTGTAERTSLSGNRPKQEGATDEGESHGGTEAKSTETETNPPETSSKLLVAEEDEAGDEAGRGGRPTVCWRNQIRGKSSTGRPKS